MIEVNEVLLLYSGSSSSPLSIYNLCKRSHTIDRITLLQYVPNDEMTKKWSSEFLAEKWKLIKL